MPSLILIDGGLGQLHAAAEALESLGLTSQPLASIAKKRRSNLPLRQRRRAHRPRPPLARAASHPANSRREPSLCRRLSPPAPCYARQRLRATGHSRRRPANPPASAHPLRQPARRPAGHGRILASVVPAKPRKPSGSTSISPKMETIRRRNDHRLSEQSCCRSYRGRRGHEEWRWPDRRSRRNTQFRQKRRNAW